MNNRDAVAIQCCEKLSQQMKNIMKEVSEKTAEQKQLQLKTETTRLKANTFRDAPADLASDLVESELNSEACRTACREIEALRQSYKEKWTRAPAAESDQNSLLKDLDLERAKLIHLEIQLENIREEQKDRQVPRINRVPELINQFATTLSKVKSSTDKFDMMKRRYEISLNEVTVNGSQHRYLLTALRARSQTRQVQQHKIDERYRSISTANFVKEHMRCSESAETLAEPEESYEDMDEEILKERLMSERETNKQLEGLYFCTQHWLLQEENFEKEVEMLDATNQET